MIQIIEEIKQTLQQGSSYDINANVKRWMEDLKQRGISVAVLEELLHFYAAPHHTITDADGMGYYLVSEVEDIDNGLEKKLKDLRNQYNCLTQDCLRAEQTAAAMRWQRNVAFIIAVSLFVVGFIVGLLV